MKVVIIGAGTSAKSVASILIENKDYSLSGFICSDEEKNLINSNIYQNYKVIGSREILSNLSKMGIKGFVVAVGDIKLREIFFYKAINSDLIPINVISKNAVIPNTVEIGSGIIIKAGTIVGHNVSIGDNTKIDSSCVIEVGTQIANNCNIETGTIISGEVNIKKNVHLGARSIINSYITIGKNQIVDKNKEIKSSLKDLQRTL